MLENRPEFSKQPSSLKTRTEAFWNKYKEKSREHYVLVYSLPGALAVSAFTVYIGQPEGLIATATWTGLAVWADRNEVKNNKKWEAEAKDIYPSPFE